VKLYWTPETYEKLKYGQREAFEIVFESQRDDTDDDFEGEGIETDIEGLPTSGQK